MLRLNGCDGLGLDIPRHWQHLDYTPGGMGGKGLPQDLQWLGCHLRWGTLGTTRMVGRA
jgi:hypothetical protein